MSMAEMQRVSGKLKRTSHPSLDGGSHVLPLTAAQ